VVYCQYVNDPVDCFAVAGVVLRPRSVARTAASPGAGASSVGLLPGTPTDRDDPVDRVGRH